ncbi:MAG TPA: hypothetical protein VHT53_13075 [Candidatus Elarobacter sp.]|nr:hypothetical protein [Candidatus Elarobacter sp.]
MAPVLVVGVALKVFKDRDLKPIDALVILTTGGIAIAGLIDPAAVPGWITSICAMIMVFAISTNLASKVARGLRNGPPRRDR